MSFHIFHPTTDHAPVDRLFNEACIPFGQIGDLTVGGSVVVDFPINFHIFRNLGALNITLCDMHFIGRLLWSLHPHPETGIPCQSFKIYSTPVGDP